MHTAYSSPLWRAFIMALKLAVLCFTAAIFASVMEVSWNSSSILPSFNTIFSGSDSESPQRSPFTPRSSISARWTIVPDIQHPSCQNYFNNGPLNNTTQYYQAEYSTTNGIMSLIPGFGAILSYRPKHHIWLMSKLFPFSMFMISFTSFGAIMASKVFESNSENPWINHDEKKKANTPCDTCHKMSCMSCISYLILMEEEEQKEKRRKKMDGRQQEEQQEGQQKEESILPPAWKCIALSILYHVVAISLCGFSWAAEQGVQVIWACTYPNIILIWHVLSTCVIDHIFQLSLPFKSTKVFLISEVPNGFKLVTPDAQNQSRVPSTGNKQKPKYKKMITGIPSPEDLKEGKSSIEDMIKFDNERAKKRTVHYFIFVSIERPLSFGKDTIAKLAPLIFPAVSVFVFVSAVAVKFTVAAQLIVSIFVAIAFDVWFMTFVDNYLGLERRSHHVVLPNDEDVIKNYIDTLFSLPLVIEYENEIFVNGHHAHTMNRFKAYIRRKYYPYLRAFNLFSIATKTNTNEGLSSIMLDQELNKTGFDCQEAGR